MAKQGRCKNASCPDNGHWHWDRDLPLHLAKCPTCRDALYRTTYLCQENDHRAFVNGQNDERHLLELPYSRVGMEAPNDTDR